MRTEEEELKEAIYALNRCKALFDEGAPIVEALTDTRDRLWKIGKLTWGWQD